MSKASWSTKDIPPLPGKIIVITGANSGLGYAATLELARKRAHVVMACRNLEKAEGAAARIRQEVPEAALEIIGLDLGSLASVRAFAQEFLARSDRLDVLVNNAGIMALPHSKTVDGFESQMGTNHFGHFALTGLLLPALLTAPAARVVTVSSLLHRIGRIDFDDLDGERGYRRWSAYGQSKLANLLFTFELQRRFERAGVPALSVGCHPGYAATNLQRRWSRSSAVPLMQRMSELAVGLVGQDARAGALPMLFAATAPDVEGADVIGPGGAFEVTGPPTKVKVVKRAHDPETAARLWSVSAERTGVDFGALEIEHRTDANAS